MMMTPRSLGAGTDKGRIATNGPPAAEDADERLADEANPVSTAPAPHQAGGYVGSGYLDFVGGLFRPIKERSYALMRINLGHSVLDLGCGIGIDTQELARRVGSSGLVVGVDQDLQMVSEANYRARQAGTEVNVLHVAGQAESLPHPDGCFDSCRSERMLMHMADAEGVADELTRVLKPGGWLVLIEPDWATFSISSGLGDIERRIARFNADKVLRNGYAGRQLHALLRLRQFQDISIEIAPVICTDYPQLSYLTFLTQIETLALDNQILNRQELEDWRQDLRLKDEQACFMASLGMVVVAGRKPGRG